MSNSQGNKPNILGMNTIQKLPPHMKKALITTSIASMTSLSNPKTSYASSFNEQISTQSTEFGQYHSNSDHKIIASKVPISQEPINEVIVKQNSDTIFEDFITSKRPSFNKPRSTLFIQKKKTFFEDSYNIGDPIGTPGAFGAVHECWKKSDLLQTTKYAVKKIFKARFYHINQKQRDEIKKHMKNEILIQKMLSDHENIVKYVDTFEDTLTIHLVMEYIDGPELLDRIKNHKMLTEKKASIYLKQILNALDYMNKFKICHLDLKPDNIMFASDTSDLIKVIDFGMSQFVPS